MDVAFAIIRRLNVHKVAAIVSEVRSAVAAAKAKQDEPAPDFVPMHVDATVSDSLTPICVQTPVNVPQSKGVEKAVGCEDISVTVPQPKPVKKPMATPARGPHTFRVTPGDPVVVRPTVGSTEFVGELMAGDVVQGYVRGDCLQLVSGGFVRLKYLVAHCEAP